MSAVAELKAGKTGDAFYTLLRKTIAAVAAGHNFPPPRGSAGRRTRSTTSPAPTSPTSAPPNAISTMVAKCGGDAALARYLQGVVRNFLRDRGRATEIGRLTVRIRRALREGPAFVNTHGDYWRLADGPVEASEAGPDSLIAAAAMVKVVFAWRFSRRPFDPSNQGRR